MGTRIWAPDQNIWYHIRQVVPELHVTQMFSCFCKMFWTICLNILHVLLKFYLIWLNLDTCFVWVELNKNRSELIYIIRNWISTLEFGFVLGLKGETLCICFDVPSIDRFLLSIFKYFSLNLKSDSPLKSTHILILNKWTHAAIFIFGPLQIFKGILFRLGT